LSAEKDVPEVPAELRARLAERLLASTSKAAVVPAKTSAAAAAVVVVGQGAAATKGLGAWALSSKLLLAGVVTFGVGGGAGAALHSMAARPQPSTATSVIVVEAPPRAASVVVVGPASAAPVVTAAPTAEPVTEPAVASAKPSAAPRLATSASADPLRRERSLLDTARAAVLRGDKAAALESLSKHAREFPNGQHAADRLALEKRANALP
jgi:hypothetical protein